MPTQYDEKIRQAIIAECGFPPHPLDPVFRPAYCQIHADCASRVAHEYERKHTLEATLDAGGDIITAPLAVLSNPFVLIAIVIIIVLFIGWGIKSGIQTGAGEAGKVGSKVCLRSYSCATLDAQSA